MRVAGYALLGFLSGAIAGLILAWLSVALWYDVLRIGSHGPDGLGGFGALVGLSTLLSLLLGIAGAIWMGMRGRTAPAGPSCALVIALILVPLMILFSVILGVAI